MNPGSPGYNVETPKPPTTFKQITFTCAEHPEGATVMDLSGPATSLAIPLRQCSVCLDVCETKVENVPLTPPKPEKDYVLHTPTTFVTSDPPAPPPVPRDPESVPPEDGYRGWTDGDILAKRDDLTRPIMDAEKLERDAKQAAALLHAKYSELSDALDARKRWREGR